MEKTDTFPEISLEPKPVAKSDLPVSSNLPERLNAIDVFRALTMLLMIFVNDLWTLQNIPYWLGHMKAGEDGLGLADVVFPAFLFIVGLSIPFAINNRLKKGDTRTIIISHIILRSLALIIMGFFHVNLESYSSLSILPKPVWQILITTGFFLVWLDYSEKTGELKKYILQGAGIFILAMMAYLYTGGTSEDPVWMRFQWYGILGLIGWSYLIVSSIYLVFNNKIGIHLFVMTFFILFKAAVIFGWLEPVNFIKPYFWIVGDGSIPAFTMAGVVVSLHYLKFRTAGKIKNYWILTSILAFIMLLFGSLTRPLWGIHKIGASPSWTTISISLSIIAFIFLLYLVDLKKKKHWFQIIKPAGTSTLTCYLLPYIHYALFSLIGISLPIFLRTGVVGIIKSLVYAVIIILITGWLEKRRIRLKV